MKFHIWGSGPVSSALLHSAEPTEAAEAAALAAGHSFDGPEDWAIEIEGDEDEVDAATRFDSAVVGWQPAK